MKNIIFIFLFILLCSCTVNQANLKSDFRARIDPISISNQDQFEHDLDLCSQFAAQEIERAQGEFIAKTIIGGVIGFGAGALIGSSWGHSLWKKTGTAGAVGGAIGGGASAQNRKDIIFGNCMINRGYKILW